MPSDPYSDALNILTATATQRVWSVLVSVFGDLARHEGEGDGLGDHRQRHGEAAEGVLRG